MAETRIGSFANLGSRVGLFGKQICYLYVGGISLFFARFRKNKKLSVGQRFGLDTVVCNNFSMLLVTSQNGLALVLCLNFPLFGRLEIVVLLLVLAFNLRTSINQFPKKYYVTNKKRKIDQSKLNF